MINILLVGVGGFLGSVLRYLLGGWVHAFSGQHGFPYGTLVVNILGCFLIGFAGGIMESKGVANDAMRLFLFVGLLGGFTTFSSFSHETVGLMRSMQSSWAFLNVILQVTVGLSAAWFGHYLSILKGV